MSDSAAHAVEPCMTPSLRPRFRPGSASNQLCDFGYVLLGVPSDPRESWWSVSSPWSSDNLGRSSPGPKCPLGKVYIWDIPTGTFASCTTLLGCFTINTYAYVILYFSPKFRLALTCGFNVRGVKGLLQNTYYR